MQDADRTVQEQRILSFLPVQQEEGFDGIPDVGVEVREVAEVVLERGRCGAVRRCILVPAGGEGEEGADGVREVCHPLST